MAQQVAGHEQKEKAESKKHFSSTEESKTAKEMIDKMTPKEKRAKIGSLSHFTKECGDTDLDGSRGEARQQYLHRFLVHMMRIKDAAKVVQVSEKKTVPKKKRNHLGADGRGNHGPKTWQGYSGNLEEFKQDRA